MRIAVFSDSHGVREPMLAAIEEQKPDMVLHLGDYVRDAEAIAAYFPTWLRWTPENIEGEYVHSDKKAALITGTKTVYETKFDGDIDSRIVGI